MTRDDACVALLFVALAIVMTWPLAMHVGTAVAHPGDPFINTWILDWDWHATLHRPSRLFHANAFHPAQSSLAFSENLYGIALLLFPLRAVGVSPIAAYNLAMLAGFAFSGFAMYLLAMRLARSKRAGITAGIFFAFVPFRFTQLSHLQHEWTAWLPLLLLALLQYRQKPSWRNGAWFGLAFVMNGLTNIHWLLFGSLAIALTLLLVRPRSLLPLAACGAAAALLLAPFLWPYHQVAKLYGMERGWSETLSFSATLHDWLVAGTHTRLYAALALTDSSVDPERWLFPGFLSIVLAAIGIAAVFSKKEEVSDGEGLFATSRLTLSIAILWIVLGVVGSLGLHTFFHRFLFEHVPGFRAIRVPARWAMIAYCGMAILVAMATAWLGRNRRWAPVVLSLAFLAELSAAPIRWYLVLPDAPPVYAWLATTKPHAILELPLESGDLEYLYMLRSTAHHRPMVNGVSGFTPPDRIRLAAQLRQRPIGDDVVEALRRIGCDRLVVHADAIDEATREWLMREVSRGGLTFVRRFDGGIRGDWLLTMNPRPPGPAIALDPKLASMLRGDFTENEETFGTLDYPRPREVIGHNALFSGWALSPYSVRKVDLLFDNGRRRYPTKLIAEPSLTRGMPWYPVPRPRFLAAFPRRPDDVRPITDVQVEITDGRGVRTLLEDRWFDWP